jgi:hypothetical protein
MLCPWKFIPRRESDGWATPVRMELSSNRASALGPRSLSGFSIDGAFGQIGEFFISGLFFFERLAEQLAGLAVSQAIGEGACSAISRDLVMFDALRSADEAGVAYHVLGVFANELAAFPDEAFHRLAPVVDEVAIAAFGDLLEALDMFLGLFEVLFEAASQVFVGGGLRHLWQRLHELGLGTIEVLELVDEKILECIEFHFCVA